MAERRMFARTIIDSDAFLDMPQSSQLLYFHLSMRADDDGFINKPKSVMRIVGAKDDDIKLLIAKKFIIPFESGIVVIKHWKIHNFIAKDRYIETKYKNEKSLLTLDENKSYTMNEEALSTECLQVVNELDTQVRLGKDRLELGKDSKDIGASKSPRFSPPSLSDVADYCKERGKGIDPEKFYYFYESNGWMVGKNRMKNWKAAVINWEKGNRIQTPKPEPTEARPVRRGNKNWEGIE